MSKQNYYKALKSLKALYQEGKYVHALLIASKHPKLQQSLEYRRLEEHFQALLRRAACLIKEGKELEARELIGEYVRIEQKQPTIKLLLRHGVKFLEFLKAISKEDLDAIFHAIKECNEFAKHPSFVALQERIKRRLARLEQSMEQMELDLDYSMLNKWAHYPIEGAARLQRKLMQLQRLQNSYDRGDLGACYDLCAQEELVQNSTLAKALQSYWYARFERAKLYAASGNLVGIYLMLRPFKDASSKQAAIKGLLYQATKRRIKELIKKGELAKAERMLFDAANYFGRQSELVDLAIYYYKQSGTKVLFYDDSAAV